ncbi:hypothetical protein [Kribbella qitaiheensis]|uniref:hypothetical protein n=1 Tax=Kribbella qitaiheensis TaxID=1544730 RepID=UPI001629F969|nr:hypothetical protein [Kribbella qitaiheensis]
MVEQPENQQPEVPDADLRAAIEGLDDLSAVLRKALADDDALAADGTIAPVAPGSGELGVGSAEQADGLAGGLAQGGQAE